MESINEIIAPQIFSQQMLDETTEYMAIGHQGHQIQEPKSDCDEVKATLSGIKYVKSRRGTESVLSSSSMQTLIATTTDSTRNHDNGDPNSCPVVMVIDEVGHSNLQTTYQIIPQQLQMQSETCRSLPLSLLSRADRLTDHTSIDFVSSDITLDGLTVSTIPSQFVAVKQEHKLVMDRHERNENPNVHCGLNNEAHHLINRSTSPHIDLNLSNINVRVIDDISSDGGIEEDSLNQHQQQLLEDQPSHHHFSHRIDTSSELVHQSHHQCQQQRSVHTVDHHGNGLHREALSVIVQSQEDEDDCDEEGDVERDSGGHLLSPGIGVVDALKHSTYQTLTSVNNRVSPPAFSPTSYATLTPIQPLPPISTMSEKFAYAGHISGGGNSTGTTNGGSVASSNRINNCDSGPSTDGTSNEDCVPYASLPMPLGTQQRSLSNLNLSRLGAVQSPYSSYSKLPSIMSPPSHVYSVSPSHGMSSMVGPCDLHGHSSSIPSPMPGLGVSGGCDSASPQPELQSNSPQQQVSVSLSVHKSVTNEGLGHEHDPGDQAMQLVAVTLQKQIIGLSPKSVVGDTIVASDYDSSYRSHQHADIIMTTSHSSANSTGRCSQLRLQHSPTLSSHSVSAGSVASISVHSPTSVITLPHVNGSVANISVDLPVVVSLTPPSPQGSDSPIVAGVKKTLQRLEKGTQPQSHQQHITQSTPKHSQDGSKCNSNKYHHLSSISSNNNMNLCNISQLQQQQHQTNDFLSERQQQSKVLAHTTTNGKSTSVNGGNSNMAVPNRSSGVANDIEEINTKDLAQRISAELKRYSIPQAIFAQRVLCRSQGTLSDLLRNPKPWSKLKSGRETFRRMFKWLQEPEFQRMSALRMAAAQIPQRPTTGTTSGCLGSPIESISATSSIVHTNTIMDSVQASNISAIISASTTGGPSTGVGSNISNRRKEEPHIEHMPQPKKPRLVFTDLQRRTLQAIFKETKRPSKEMQVTIARQLGLEPTTVGNFFMNARRRSMDKWRDDDTKNVQQLHDRHQHIGDSEEEETDGTNATQGHYSSSLHTTAISPLGNFEDESEMDLELEHHDFLVDENDNDEHEDLL